MDSARADTIALAHQVLAASQDANGADQLRLLARALSAAVLAEPRDHTALVFERDAADQARSALVAFCASARRFTAGRGLTARLLPVAGPPVTGELLDLDTSQDGQHRLVIAPAADGPAATAAAPVRIFDLYDDLRQVQILPPPTVAPIHLPPPTRPGHGDLATDERATRSRGAAAPNSRPPRRPLPDLRPLLDSTPTVIT